MVNEKSVRFRQLLESPGVISSPVCYDAVSARMAQRCGFDLVAMGGNGTMASLIGYPDLGIATATEMTGRARQIAARIDIPMYCDADSGYGGLSNVRRTVRDYEDAGVSGIHLEDLAAKRGGIMAGVSVVSTEEAVQKIKIAVAARRDPNFVIIARTDAYPDHGINEAIRRCKVFADAGADVVFPCYITDIDHFRKVGAEVTEVPLMADLIDSKGVSLRDEEVGDMGFKIVTRGGMTILSVTRLLEEMFTNYRQTGSMADYADRAMSIEDYEQLLGIESELDIEHLIDDVAGAPAAGA